MKKIRKQFARVLILLMAAATLSVSVLAGGGGWVQSGGHWYYLTSGGAWQTGWVWDGNAWYYMNASGVMQTGWVQVGGVWYFLDGSGAMRTGWVLDGGTWYYMDSSGAMQTGWLQSGNVWYYLKSSGAMARNETLSIGGVSYRFGADGAWISDGTQNAVSVWNSFLSSGGYKKYTSSFNYAQSLEYAILDMNGFGEPELIIQASEGTGFYYTWLFEMDNSGPYVMYEQYGYGSFRYSPGQNYVIASPETRPFSLYGSYQFIRLNSDYSFYVGYDEGRYFYSDEKGVKFISQSAYAAYFADAITFNWNTLW